MPATPCPPPPAPCTICTDPPAPKCWKVTPDYGPLKNRTYYFLPAPPNYIFDPNPSDAFGFNLLIPDPYAGCIWTNAHGWLYVGPWIEPTAPGYNALQYCGMLIAIREADGQWTAYLPIATDTCTPNLCDPKAYGPPYPPIEKCGNCASHCTHQKLHLPIASCEHMAQPEPIAWNVYGPPTHTPIDIITIPLLTGCQWRLSPDTEYIPFKIGETRYRGPNLVTDKPRPRTYRVSLSFYATTDIPWFSSYPEPPPAYHYYKLIPHKPTIEDIEAADWTLNPHYLDGLPPGWEDYDWHTQPIVRHYEPFTTEDLIGTPTYPPTHYAHPGPMPQQFRLTYLPTGQTYIASPTWHRTGLNPIKPAYTSPGPTLHHTEHTWYIIPHPTRWRGGAYSYPDTTPTTATLSDDYGPTWTIEPA